MTHRTSADPLSVESATCHSCGSIRGSSDRICTECGSSAEEWRQWCERNSPVWKALHRRMRAATSGVLVAVALWVLCALAMGLVATHFATQVPEVVGTLVIAGIRWAALLGAIGLAFRLDLALRSMPTWALGHRSWPVGTWIPAGSLALVSMLLPPMLGHGGGSIGIVQTVSSALSLTVTAMHWSQIRAIAAHRMRCAGLPILNRRNPLRRPLTVISGAAALGVGLIVLKESSATWPPTLSSASGWASVSHVGSFLSFLGVAAWGLVVIASSRELNRWVDRG